AGGRLRAPDAVNRRGPALGAPPAPTDLWAGIASRIGPAGSTGAQPGPRRVHELPARGRAARAPRTPIWAVPQWALAAAVFAVVALGVSWIVQSRLTPTLRRPADRIPVSVAAPGPDTDASAASFDAAQVESQIGELQQALAGERDKLDPKTVQVLEENLRIIRKATEDARQALERDPANRNLRQYFAGSVQSKLELVRRTAQLAGV